MSRAQGLPLYAGNCQMCGGAIPWGNKFCSSLCANRGRVQLKKMAGADTFKDLAGCVPKHQPGVYVIGSSDAKCYKIGRSRNLRNRVASYSSLPIRLDYMTVWMTRSPAALEEAAHTFCAAHRLSINGAVTEWFTLTPERLRQLETFLLCDATASVMAA